MTDTTGNWTLSGERARKKEKRKVGQTGGEELVVSTLAFLQHLKTVPLRTMGTMEEGLQGQALALCSVPWVLRNTAVWRTLTEIECLIYMYNNNSLPAVFQAACSVFFWVSFSTQLNNNRPFKKLEMVYCGVFAALSLLLAVVGRLCLGLFITRMVLSPKREQGKGGCFLL